MINKIYIAYDDYNSNVVRTIGTIRQTCNNSALRNGVKIIEIRKINDETRQQYQDKN